MFHGLKTSKLTSLGKKSGDVLSGMDVSRTYQDIFIPWFIRFRIKYLKKLKRKLFCFQEIKIFRQIMLWI